MSVPGNKISSKVGEPVGKGGTFRGIGIGVGWEIFSDVVRVLEKVLGENWSRYPWCR